MGREHPDRRVRRTRRRLKEALLGLLGEKRYDEITVRDLCERADVGRSTFYAHYDSKEDLLFSGFDEWLFELVEKGPHGVAGPMAANEPTDARFRFSLPLLEHIRTRRRFFRATIAGGRESRIRRRTTDLIAELARRELARGTAAREGGDGGPVASPEERARLEARAYAVAGAFLAIASWWMENPRKLSAEMVDRVLQTTVRTPGS